MKSLFDLVGNKVSTDQLCAMGAEYLEPINGWDLLRIGNYIYIAKPMEGYTEMWEIYYLFDQDRGNNGD